MEHIFILSMLVFAIHYTMQEGEVFGWVGDLFARLPKFIHQPLFDCPVCMVPWYGTIIFFIFWPGDITDWIMTTIPAMGLNAVILKLSPDKDTPGYHHELGEIVERLTDTNQLIKSSTETINIDSESAENSGK